MYRFLVNLVDKSNFQFDNQFPFQLHEIQNIPYYDIFISTANKMKTFFRKKGLKANKSELHKSFYSLEGKLLFARKNSFISSKWSLDIYLKELN